ncbi:MAG: glycoside hydrolase family 2 protein [Akkermansiaceae bacterium]|nr:glycoside hydrolase family 2 protein [Verrucomicrobiales bacterium]
MKRLILTVLLLSALNLFSAERLSLDQGWRFHLGDIPMPVIKGHDPSYQNAKAGRAWGAAAPDFDDTAWRELDLPHDWAVEGPFDENENLSQGYRPRGVGWYRRQFKLDAADRGRHLELQFDGVATHCTVWFNGTIVHRNWCGYTSSYIDITPMVQYGDSLNTIVVRVDANPMEGWWYEGAGIYRHTWLVKRSPLHLITDGVYANPVRAADGSWSLPVEATLENSGRDSASAEIEVTLLDPAGKEVGRAKTQATVASLNQAVARLSIPVASPKLWSVDEPVLYQVRTVVMRDGKSADELTTTCGFRTLRFDVEKGFFLNDQPLKLKGVCNHQDHAGVGVAVPDSLWEFRLRRLKEMGVNAYRCAHNPPAAEFLDACDRMGILVMDENRNFNSSPEYVRQLEWLIRRDRNHPSVILWSVFNEEPMQGTEAGYEMVRRMAAVVKKLDATRPVTAAMNGGMFGSLTVAHAVDVVGFNYQIGSYDRFHRENPKLPMTSSEDTSGVMTRGEFFTDRKQNILDSYDTQHPSWGTTHRNAWKAIATRPYLAGGFIWTGFDYRGEPTPFKWPSVSSFFGCMDVCGFPKTAFYLHQAQWVENKPILTLVPHWNWPGREGRPIKVMALANADTVTLSLNGQTLGEKPVDKFEMVSWDVPYAAGRLEAIGKKDGKEVSRFTVETTGEPAALRLTPDRASLQGDGWDAQPITVEALDKEGRPVPTAKLPVEFEIVGPGEIIGHGNGDPNCHEPEQGNRRSLFNGLAQVIVRSKRDGSGGIVLRAKAGGLESTETRINVTATPAPPFVAKAQPIFNLQRWRMSPVTTNAPGANQELAENDQNSWQQVQPGRLQTFAEGSHAIYRIKFKPLASVQKAGGQIVFKSVTGKAEVWLDKKLLGRKDTLEAAPFTIAIPAGEGERTLSVLIQTETGKPGGFGGGVVVETKPGS